MFYHRWHADLIQSDDSKKHCICQCNTNLKKKFFDLPAVSKCSIVKKTCGIWADILCDSSSNRGWSRYSTVDGGVVYRTTGWTGIDF